MNGTAALTGKTTALTGAAIVDAFASAGVEFVVALPDIVTCEGVLWPISSDDRFRLVMVCKEDEGVSICSALSYANRRAVLLIQHTGFLDSVNAIRAMCTDYGLPVVMAVGLQGMEPDLAPAQSRHAGIRMLEPIIDAMQIGYTILDEHSTGDEIVSRIERAYAEPAPFVFLIPRSPL